MTVDREAWVGKNVTVLGLGIEGVDVVRYLAKQGATVTVSDSRSPEQLSVRISELDGLPVQFSLGENRIEDAVSADTLFVSQGVPQSLAAIEAAREQGVPISSMTRLFLELCPGTTIGITGSSGKTTTTALVGAMFAAAGRKHVVGGNIGVGLLGLLDCITPDTSVILELSHTQLETAESSPHLACVLNVTPNHLDRYDWDEYVALKLRILQFQKRDDIAVLNLNDDVVCSFATETPAHIVWFSTRREPNGDAAAYLRDGTLFWRQNSVETKLIDVPDIPLRGAHNIENVLAAIAVACSAGIGFEAVSRAIREFQPVAHRLERVATIDGVAYYNDSIATTPERAIAGLRSYREPVVLLLGGREKNLPLEELAQEAVERCRGVVCFGEAGGLLDEAISYASGQEVRDLPIERVETLEEAVETAQTLAQPGDVVLLSPACTSYDAYANFEERGEDFRRIVQRLTTKGGIQPSQPPRRAG